MSRHAAPAPRRARADRRAAGTPAGSTAPLAAAPISAADLVRRYHQAVAAPDLRMSDAITEPLPHIRPTAELSPVALLSSTGPVEGPSSTDPLTVAELMARYGHDASAERRSHRAASRRSPGRVVAALPDLRFTARPALAAAAVLVTAAAAAEGPSLFSGSSSSATAAGGQRSASASAPAPGSSALAGPAAPTGSTSTPGAGPTGSGRTTSRTTAEPSEPTAPRTSRPTRVSRNTKRTVVPNVHLKPGQTVPGIWVLPNPGPETSCFCMRWGSMHWGIDLAGPMGSPILAVGDGTVLQAGPADGFGNWVVIQHSNGDVSIYGHMQYYFVQPGQKVKAGQRIALVGSEGESTGPHLHFEVHQGGLGGQKIDPVPWLKARGISVGPYNPNG